MIMMTYMGVVGLRTVRRYVLYEMLYRYNREERILEDDAR